MNRLTPIHGRELIKILCNKFGFRAIRQKGSHVTLYNGEIHVTVPAKEIQVGLLKVIEHTRFAFPVTVRILELSTYQFRDHS